MSYMKELRESNPGLENFSDAEIAQHLPDIDPEMFAGKSPEESLSLATQDNNFIADAGRLFWAGAKETTGQALTALELATGSDWQVDDDLIQSGKETYQNVDPLLRHDIEKAGFQEESENTVAGVTGALAKSGGSMVPYAVAQTGAALTSPLTGGTSTFAAPAAVNAAVIAGGNYHSVKDQINALSYEDLEGGELFANYLARSEKFAQGDEAKALARAQMADDLARDAATEGAWIGGLSGAVLGPALSKMFRGGQGALKGAGTGAAAEGGQEFVESGAESYAVESAKSEAIGFDVDYNRVVRDAAFGATLGAGAGGTLGAATGALAPTPIEHSQERINEAVEKAAAEGGDSLDQAVAGGKAQAETVAAAVSETKAQAKASSRDMSGLDGLIIIARREGVAEEEARLTNAKNLYERALQYQRAGDIAAADRLQQKADQIVRDVSQVNEPIKQEATASFPVPFTHQGTVEGTTDLVPGRQSAPESVIEGETITDPQRLEYQTALLADQRGVNRLENAGVIYGEEPAEVTAVRQQREADNFNAFYGQEGQANFQQNVIEGELDRSNELPDNRAKRLPPGTGQIDLGQQRPDRQFKPVDPVYSGVGENIVQRQGGDKAALPRPSTISPDQYRELQTIQRQAVRTPVSKRTEEQRQAVAVVSAVKSGSIKVAESAKIKPQSRGKSSQVDTSRHTFAQAIALSGGLSREAAQDMGVDPAHFADKRGGVFGKPLFRKNGGLSEGELFEVLSQQGMEYIQTQEEFRERLFDHLGGKAHYTAEGYVRQAEEEAMLREQFEEGAEPIIEGQTSEESILSVAVDEARQAGVAESRIHDILQTNDNELDVALELRNEIDQLHTQGLPAGNGSEGRGQTEAAAGEFPAGESTNPEQVWGSEDFELNSYTEADISAQEQAIADADASAATQQKTAQAKVDADSEVNDFTLTGSDRAADVAAGRGQNDMFDSGVAENSAEAYTDESTESIKSESENVRESGSVHSEELREQDPASEQAERNLLTASGLSGREQSAQIKDNFRVQYKQVPVGSVSVAFDVANTPSEVAHIVAPFRKHAQETMLALVTDKTGKVVNLIRHTKGTKNASSVYPVELISAIAATENGANVWFSHNHPSGSLDPSKADIQITDKLQGMLDASGVDFKGHVIVAPGNKATFFKDEIRSTVAIKAAHRNKSVSVTERVIRKRNLDDALYVTSPDAAFKVAKETASEDAIILLSNANQHIGSLAISSYEMQQLRSGGQVRRILSAIDATNTAAVLIKTQNKDSAENVARFLNSLDDIRVLDWISESNGRLVSDMADGGRVNSSSGAFFSRSGSGADLSESATGDVEAHAGLTVDAAESAVVNIRKRLGLRGVKISVVASESGLPEVIRKQAAQEGAEGAIGAVYHDNSIYIVADQMQSVTHLESVIFHEAAHYGSGKLFGKDLTSAYNKLWMKLGGFKKLKALAEELGVYADMEPYFTTAEESVLNGSMSTARRSAYLIDEFLAHVNERQATETLPAKVKRAIQEFVGAVRDVIRKLGLKNLEEVSQEDIAFLLKRINASAQNYDSAKGQPHFMNISEEDQQLMFLSNLADQFEIEELAAFSRQSEVDASKVLEQWQRKLKMARHSKNLDFVIEVKAPLILRELGILKTVSLTKRRMSAILDKHKELPRKVLEELPVLLADPSVIYTRKKGDTNAVIEVTTSAGEPILVGMQDGIIKTVTPKNHHNGIDGNNRLATEIAGSRVLYARNKEALTNAKASIEGRHSGATIAHEHRGVRGQGLKGKILFKSDVVKKHNREDDGQPMFSRKSRSRAAEQFADLNEDQTSFLGKIAPKTTAQRIKDRIAEALDRGGLKVRQGMIDRYAALFELDKQAQGEEVVENNTRMSSWVLAKMSHAADGALSALMSFGRIRFSDGVIQLQNDQDESGGLMGVLSKLGSGSEVERFMGWIAANRSAKLSAEGRENLFTEEEIAASIDLNKGETAEGKQREALYEEVFAEFQQYRDDVLKIAQEAGIISESNYDMWKDEFYVPFYRVMEEQDVNGPRMSGGLSRQQAYKKLKGGSQELNDLLENTLLNFQHLLSSSLKNNAASQAIDNAMKVGIAEQTSESARDKKASTFVLEGGEKRWYNISDPLVFESLTSLNDPATSTFSRKLMRSFKRVFTSFITSSPQFMVANGIRDTLHAMAIGNLSYNGFKNFAGGLKDYGSPVHKGKLKGQMMATGASFSFGHVYGSGDADALHAELERTIKGAKVLRDPKDVPGMIRQAWDFYSGFGDAAENANRTSMYKQNLEKGELYAAFQARDLMDFSSHGAWPAVRFLVDTVPFLNARLIGLDRMYRGGVKPTVNVIKQMLGGEAASMTDKQAAQRFAIVTGALTAASIALYLHNKDDEEFQKLEDWQRDMYWFVRVGDSAYFIPKPFEIGAIATVAERGLEQMVDDTKDGKLFLERMGHVVTDTFAFNPVPQMFKPVLDVYANKSSFTGRDIETMGMDRLSKVNRYRTNTTDGAKYISRALDSTVGKVSENLVISPVQADYLIQQYLGWVGTMGATTVDIISKQARGHEDPAKDWTEHQPIRRFFRDTSNPSYTRYGTEFYDALRETNRVYADIKHLRKMGEEAAAAELAAENGNKLRLRAVLNKANKTLSKLNTRSKLIQRNNKLSATEKRQRLDIILKQRNIIQVAMIKKVEKR
ncbi:LPD38 domain-containing protein [Aliamphritea hakodatensis]|uniref:LPD38 domain-containing protein n=1 Tax=Aliamphritea hakodatensis TaxID=2895352 RepID=UPI0022FD6F51|nr:LPD38 domain-containing protein [Aliamphritea hakodatensis]